MPDSIPDAGSSEKQSVLPVDETSTEARLASSAPSEPVPQDVYAVVQRLADEQVIPNALLDALSGPPVAGGVAAADDPGSALSDATKRDHTGKGSEVVLPRMRDTLGAVSPICPVAALERWLARARIRRGPVFRGVTAGGRLGERLSGDGVRHILLRRGSLAGLTVPAGERLSPHGLRAGFITETHLAAPARRLDR